MGMGAYDESEQNRREENKDVDVDDAEAVTTTKYDGEVSYETPDSVDDLLDNFQG